MTHTFLALKPALCEVLTHKYHSANSDAVEDCFMKAVELLLEQSDIPQKPEVWVQSATELLLRNELRKSGRLRPLVAAASLSSAEQIESDVSMLCDVELMFRILRPAYAEIIRERHVEGLSIEEIAKKQRKSVAAVYKTYERATEKARKILTAMGYAGGG